MPAESQNIQVVCDATTYLSFTAVDDRAGTELTAGDANFGLGTYGDTKIGFYTVNMSNAFVKANPDAEPVKVSVKAGNTLGVTNLVSKSQVLAWATGVNNLSPGQIFTADFAVKPTINGTLKNSAGDAKLDGYAVLTFAFGV